MKEFLPVGDSDLVELQLKDQGKCLCMTFSFAGFAGGEGKEVRVELFGIKELEYSLVEDQEAVYFVGELWVEETEFGIKVGSDGEFYMKALCTHYEVTQISMVSTASKKNNFAVGKNPERSLALA
jgi:hypothetical protein